MSKPFLRALSLSDAQALLARFGPNDAEKISIERGVFRVLAESIKASEDLPGFDRSTMDGFAVRSSDTFGASEAIPGLLSIVGEIDMGEMPDFALRRGETARIWTGGALPAGADAVVMVEHAELMDNATLEIFRAVAPFENVVRKGEDFKAGEVLLRAGRRLLPQDLGMLAAVGRAVVEARRTPKVALISSGDEITPIDQEPPAGCVRDVNRYSLTAMILEAHAISVWIGVAPDTLAAVSSMIHEGLEAADVVIISGGSSMGARDHVIEAIQAYEDSEILAHGVAISPGKPLILARVGRKPVVGLPGHPVSAMVCFDHFVAPLLRRLEGEPVTRPFSKARVDAVLSRNLPSREGRTDFIRVRLQRREGTVFAVPVPAKSGMISSMVRADGFVRIESDCEGLYKGEVAPVHLFAPWLEGEIEKEHISGHEAAGGGPGDLLGASRQERLSRVGTDKGS